MNHDLPIELPPSGPIRTTSIVMCFGPSLCEQYGIPFVPADRSETKVCPSCSRLIWVGPKQMEMVNAGNPLMCIACAVERFGRDAVLGSMRSLTREKSHG